MFKSKYLVALFLLFTLRCFGQASLYSNIALNGQGRPLAGVSVAVCTQPATIGTSTTPCSPLATLYTSTAGSTHGPNPVSTDGLGNYSFYATPGTYSIQLYGPSVQPVLYKDVIVVCAPGIDCGPGAGSVLLNPSGNQTVTQPGGTSLTINTLGTVGNGALKPLTPASIQYAAVGGNDSNDGLSPGTAKLDIYTALCSLPGGNCGTQTAGSGFVYVLDGGTVNCGAPVSMNPTPAAGIWLMGSSDPNYASPGAGWLKAVGPISIIGMSGACEGGSVGALGSLVAVKFSSGGDANQALYLAGPNGAIYIKGIYFPTSQQPLSMGYDSTGTIANAGGVVDFTSEGNAFVTDNNSASYGPTVRIGANSFENNFYNTVLGANYNATPQSDASENILINANGLTASFDLKIKDSNWYGCGGVKYHTAGDFAAIDIDDVHIECNTMGGDDPGLWFPDSSNEFLGVTVKNMDLPDYAATTPVVRNDGTSEFTYPANQQSGITAISICGVGEDAQGLDITIIGGCNTPQLNQLLPIALPLLSGFPYTPSCMAAQTCYGFLQASNTVADTFTRANQSGLGIEWAVNQGFSISTNTAKGTVGSSDQYGNWTPTAFSNNQFAQVTIAAGGTSTGGGGPAVRMTSLPSANGYFLYCETSTTTLYLEKVVANSKTSLGNTPENCATNDVLRLEVMGTQITTYYNGAIVPALTFTDSTFTTGSPGIYIISNTAFALKTWSGGNSMPGYNQLGFWDQSQTFGAGVVTKTLSTSTNCGAVGSAANPSLVACGSAAAGAFSCATAASTGTCVISDTAVTANSEIIVQQVVSEGARLSVTCNTASVLPSTPLLLSKVAGTSFTLTLGTVTTNPGCFVFSVIN